MARDRNELQKLTVVALRALAKKRLGRGFTKLRTKAQLVEALLHATDESPSTPAPLVTRTTSSGASPKEGLRRATKGELGPCDAKLAARESAAAPDPTGRRIPEPALAFPLDGQTLLVRWRDIPATAKDESWNVEISSAGRLERSVEVPPLAKQVHVRGLPMGATYRARLVTYSLGGQARLLASLSRPVVFYPSSAPFGQRERFVQYRWADPATSAASPELPAPGARLPSEAELLASGHEAAAQTRWSATSPAGALPGWGASGDLRPTSFAR